MNLTNLNTALSGAKTGTDIQLVLLDFIQYWDGNYSKLYPAIVWDFDNMTFTRNLRSGAERTARFVIDMYGINIITPESDRGTAKHTAWDAIEADMLAYLTKVDALTGISVVNMEEMPGEYYMPGILSMDRELGVRYRVTLDLWC